ncbi:MAG: AAA family ATPase [Clostridia bacterium]|nr:AAA family ATPase [Clostridia bacterium]
MRIEKGKILIEGMDLSGKTTITKYLSEILRINKIRERTLSDSCSIYDFTVAQSKKGTLHIDLINKLYTLAISEDLCNYKLENNGIILQDSYFALRSYALMKQKYPNTLAIEVYKLLQLFPKPELTFYLTATTEERIRRNQNRNKPMAYMEKLLLSNPEEFETIEKNLRDINISLFDAEIIDTQDKTPNEIALYIASKIQEIYIGDDVYERE